MTEPTPTYSVNDGSVCCPGCGLGIGHYVTVGRETWIQIGMIRAYAIHGRCASCHTEFHFSASEKKLEKLLERVGK